MPRLVTIGPLVSVAGHLAVFEDADGRYLSDGGSPSTGDVVGPASATDNAIARFDGATGKLLQNSAITIADGAAGTLDGSNSGDVTLAGTPNYLTIVGQVITRALINLASHVTGRLPYANLTASTAASRLLGRESGSAGDWEEITLGTTLTMTGSTLDAAGGAGGHAHGLMRLLGDGATTTFNLLDFAEYLEHVGVNGSFRDPAAFALSADRSQIVFTSAPGAGEIVTMEYVIANA